MEGSNRKDYEVIESGREETRRRLSNAVNAMCDSDQPGAFAFVRMAASGHNEVISNLDTDDLSYLLRVVAKFIADDEMGIEQ